MITHRILSVEVGGTNEVISFGVPDTEQELKQMFQFRYREYLKRGYIDANRFTDQMEKDEYDDGRSIYFIAMCKDAIIGTIRLIKSFPLPTELDFSFVEPACLTNIPVNQRAEFGRFIIVPLDRQKGKYLPKGLIMLTMFDVLLSFCSTNNILGGYSFIKQSLYKKMIRLKMPVQVISQYSQKYPKDGVLYNYFNQPNDPVIPIVFIVSDFKKYLKKITHSSLFFERNGAHIQMKDNLWVKLLKLCKII
jgi:N-acyl-L-homoserine lactone synthetase